MLRATFHEWSQKGSRIVAFADVDVAEGVIVRGFKVIRGQNGLFAAVPTKARTVNGETRYVNQVLFGDPDRRKRFLDGVLGAYRRWKGESESGAGESVVSTSASE